jgi:hypothetical protein
LEDAIKAIVIPIDMSVLDRGGGYAKVLIAGGDRDM